MRPPWLVPLLTFALLLTGCGIYQQIQAEKQAEAARANQRVGPQLVSGNFFRFGRGVFTCSFALLFWPSPLLT